MCGRHPRVRSSLAVESAQGLLMVKHQKGEKIYWMLPGGGVDFGEPAKQAVERELLEETGLQVEAQEFLFACESIAPDQSRHGLHLVFRGRVLGGQLAVGVEPDQEGRGHLIDAQWVPLAQLGRLVIHPPFQKELLEALTRSPTQYPNFLESRWIE